MRPSIIRKSAAALRLPPNLADYDAQRRDFSWDAVRAELCGASGGGINMGYAAVDRHLAGRAARPRRLPLRRPRRPAAGRHLRRARAPDQPLRQRAARARRRQGRPPVRARRPHPGALRRRARHAQERHASSARCSPRSARSRSARAWRSARGKVLVTTEALYRRKVAGIAADLPALRARAARRRERRAHRRSGHARFRDADGRGVGPAATIAPTAAEDPALLHFTSGTTGTPKGAVHVHGAVGHALRDRPATRSTCIPTTSSGAPPIRAG